MTIKVIMGGYLSCLSKIIFFIFSLIKQAYSIQSTAAAMKNFTADSQGPCMQKIMYNKKLVGKLIPSHCHKI